MLAHVLAICRLLVLPVFLFKLIIQHYTSGTVFDDEQTKRSLQRVLLAGIIQYTLKCLALQFVWNYFVDRATFVVFQLKDRLNFDRNLPNYGQFYTVRDDEAPDSFWIARTEILQPTDPILVYVFGGSFCLQFTELQVEALANIFKVLNREFANLGVLFVDHLNTQLGSRYPTQLQECTYVYDKLVAENHSNISLIGDSAGANIILSLIRSQNVKGKTSVIPRSVILVSPWLDLTMAQYSATSYERNEKLDVTNFRAAQRLGKEFISAVEEEYQEAANISANIKFDWSSIPVIEQGRILIVVGLREVLISENLNWCKRAKICDRFPQNMVIVPRGFHLYFFVSETVDYGCLENWQEQIVAKRILSFLQTQFRTFNSEGNRIYDLNICKGYDKMY